MDFHPVEANLRESFRVLARGRATADVCELPGVTLASAGVSFQMFNAAFFSGPVSTQVHLEQGLATARDHFALRGLPWAFWICEDWIEPSLRRRLSKTCANHGLRMSSEMPGMLAADLTHPRRALPELEFHRVEGMSAMMDFRTVGSMCFRVPSHWFAEVFHDFLPQEHPEFACWVAYWNGLPVATAAALVSDGAIGIYNIATVPPFRGRGIAEATTRFAISEARRAAGNLPVILQSTAPGFRMYTRLGFREVSRILVFASM